MRGVNSIQFCGRGHAPRRLLSRLAVPGPSRSKYDVGHIRVRAERDSLGVYTLDQLATSLQARFRLPPLGDPASSAPCRFRKPKAEVPQTSILTAGHRLLSADTRE